MGTPVVGSVLFDSLVAGVEGLVDFVGQPPQVRAQLQLIVETSTKADRQRVVIANGGSTESAVFSLNCLDGWKSSRTVAALGFGARPAEW